MKKTSGSLATFHKVLNAFGAYEEHKINNFMHESIIDLRS